MIGIIGAMTEEIAEIKKNINNIFEKNYSNISFFIGTIAGKDVVLMQSGIGKVNASICTTIMFEHFPIDYCINIGTAGGIKDNSEVLDVVISDRVAYHDVDVTAFNYAYGQVPKLPLYFMPDKNLVNNASKVLNNLGIRNHIGLIVSGDSFINKPNQLDSIKEHFNDALAVEMEAAAISHVCHLYNKPFIILRSLSDIAGKESNISFSSYLKKASYNSGRVVLKLIENFTQN